MNHALSRRVTWRAAIGAGAVAIALLGSAPAALAAEPMVELASRALALDGTMAGHLDPGGRAYYRFEYPGGRAPVHIELEAAAAVGERGTWGFNVYDPAGNRVAGGLPIESYIPGAATTLAAQPAGTYLVEVFSNDPAVPMGFVITGIGTLGVPCAATGCDTLDYMPQDSGQ